MELQTIKIDSFFVSVLPTISHFYWKAPDIFELTNIYFLGQGYHRRTNGERHWRHSFSVHPGSSAHPDPLFLCLRPGQHWPHVSVLARMVYWDFLEQYSKRWESRYFLQVMTCCQKNPPFLNLAAAVLRIYSPVTGQRETLSSRRPAHFSLR